MKTLRRLSQALRSGTDIDIYECAFLLLLAVVTVIYHWNMRYWAGITLVGNWQYGDAEFWWNGAVQFAEGIVKENPNLTFRMGYAVLAGLWVALAGPEFSSFHALLVLLFISVFSALYLSLRTILGKLEAAAGTVLIALNPFTAEWLAISSSDSVGLLLSLCALISLLVGLRRQRPILWFVAGGLFLAMASLTRPLMTPFFVPTILVCGLAVTGGCRPRLRNALGLLLAFGSPILLWMGAMKTVTGSWRLAGYDSSAFYAASNPRIQVWNSSMYPQVQASARRRLKVANPSPNDIDAEFWQLTFEHYSVNASYHLNRLWPHISAVASISPNTASHADPRSRLIRSLIVSALTIALCVPLFRRGHAIRGILAGLAGLLWLIPGSSGWIVCLAVVVAIPMAVWQGRVWGLILLACYWWTGTGALYLVGGTWGPPLGATTDVNALGYRLGSQFFFASDLLVLYLLHTIRTLRQSEVGVAAESPEGPSSTAPWSQGWIAHALSMGAIAFGLLLVAGLATGTSIVGYRIWSRLVAPSQPFPDITPVYQASVQEFRKLVGEPHLQVAADPDSAFLALTPDADSPYVLLTAASADFIWNLAGQDRSQLMLYAQQRVFPFDMGPRPIRIEMPRHVGEKEWSRRQGAWLLRHFRDEPVTSTLPWYYTWPAVRAFFPLGTDKHAYDARRAEWFAVVKSATQLHRAQQLSVQQGRLEFSGSSGEEQYPRRFALYPEFEDSERLPTIVIDGSKAVGKRSLKFGYQYLLAPGQLPRRLSLRIERELLPAGRAGISSTPTLEELFAVAVKTPMRKIDLNLDDPAVSRVRLEFSGLRTGDVVWIYELNLKADDWLW